VAPESKQQKTHEAEEPHHHMSQLEHIEAIEKRLWGAADTLRANSNYASNEYFLPVMGLIFLRHAYSRFLMVKEQIEPTR
jgi:type I restriction enzyme M protein